MKETHFVYIYIYIDLSNQSAPLGNPYHPEPPIYRRDRRKRWKYLSIYTWSENRFWKVYSNISVNKKLRISVY